MSACIVISFKGSGGINHGIEIYSDVVEYAEERLRTFRHLSKAIDEYDFSVPKFVAGKKFKWIAFIH